MLLFSGHVYVQVTGDKIQSPTLGCHNNFIDNSFYGVDAPFRVTVQLQCNDHDCLI